jgi:hypothetical protein
LCFVQVLWTIAYRDKESCRCLCAFSCAASTAYKLASSLKEPAPRQTCTSSSGAASVKRYAGVDESSTTTLACLHRCPGRTSRVGVVVSKVGARARFTAAIVMAALALLNAPRWAGAALEVCVPLPSGDDGDPCC